MYEFEGEMITPHEADFRKIGDYVRTILKRGKKAEEVTEKKVKIFVEKILNVILNENIKKEYLEHPEIIEHRKTKLEEEREKRFELVSEMSVEDF